MKADKKNAKAEDKKEKRANDPETAGTGEANREPTLRSSTTDSSRMHKNSNDDRPTGGNIR